MPWKEPGEKPRAPAARGPRSEGPWGGKRGPEVEAWLRTVRRRLGPFGRGPLGASALLAVAVVLWFLIGGWTIVGAGQVGVVLRFGRLQSVLQPGFHLRLPAPLDRVQKLAPGAPRSLSEQTRLMTADGQLALVDYEIRYTITDVRAFLFGQRDTEDAIRNAAAVALRVAVGTHTLAQVRDRTGSGLADGVLARLSASTAGAGLGVHIVGADIRSVGVPSEVAAAFDDIAKARAQAAAARTAAEGAVTRGKAETQTRAAALKAAAVVHRDGAAAAARADVARFEQALAQYQAAPEVTRHRLWLDTMQQVLTHNRVVINSGGGNVIVEFPPAAPPVSVPAAAASSAAAPATSVAPAVTSGPAVSGGGA